VRPSLQTNRPVLSYYLHPNPIIRLCSVRPFALFHRINSLVLLLRYVMSARSRFRTVNKIIIRVIETSTNTRRRARTRRKCLRFSRILTLRVTYVLCYVVIFFLFISFFLCATLSARSRVSKFLHRTKAKLLSATSNKIPFSFFFFIIIIIFFFVYIFKYII
jgi:hypothetical protein